MPEDPLDPRRVELGNGERGTHNAQRTTPFLSSSAYRHTRHTISPHWVADILRYLVARRQHVRRQRGAARRERIGELLRLGGADRRPADEAVRQRPGDGERR